MIEVLPAVLGPILVLMAFIFVMFRFRLFSGRGVAGRHFVLAGTIIVFLASVWEWVELSDSYHSWFVATAYAYIDIVQFAIIVLGGMLAIIGLSFYADFWQTRSRDVELREGRLTILDNLRQDSKEPYHLLDLVAIALRQIVHQSSSEAGAVFLLNRKRRQLVLTSSAGLNKLETAALEYCPLERNIVGQALEMGECLVGGEFPLTDRQGQPMEMRYRSSMALLLESGMEKIGAILLFSSEEEMFGRSEVQALSPVADWLAEKIKSARLIRELSLLKREDQRRQSELSDIIARLGTAAVAFGAGDAEDAFCRALSGTAGATSLHLFGIKRGELVIHGGSRPLANLSESYRAALVEVAGRSKPLIINQEDTADSSSRVVMSSLVIPVQHRGESLALLLRREGAPFHVDDRQLQLLDIYAHLAELLIAYREAEKLTTGRRLGFDAVLKLLQYKPSGEVGDDPECFVRQLRPVLPPDAELLTFLPTDDGRSSVVVAAESGTEVFEAFGLPVDEGIFGEAATSLQCRFAVGQSEVGAEMDRLSSDTRSAIRQHVASPDVPDLLAVCPISRLENLEAIAVIGLHHQELKELGEWRRLLTLAAGLFSLRLTMCQLAEQAPLLGEGRAISQSVANQLNNGLGAIMGSAEMASQSAVLTAEVRGYLDKISREAERAGEIVKGLLAADSAHSQSGESENGEGVAINSIVHKVLQDSRISGDLYMVGERTHEIKANLASSSALSLSGGAAGKLFESALNRLAVLAAEDDVVSVSAYERGLWVYLDISRHRRNFPSVKPVAEFGQYRTIEEAAASRPADVYLQHLANTGSHCAVDMSGSTPAFLSFRFPLKGAGSVEGTDVSTDRPVRILAIDDEAIILDLVAAMCQSLGFQVLTAENGQEGISLAEHNRLDLVITDLAMPGLSGLEVADRMKSVQSGVPVILITGWAANLNEDDVQRAGIHRVLYKPFRIEQLTEAIQSAVSVSQ